MWVSWYCSWTVLDGLKNSKDAIATLESIAKIGALVIGGWWTWLTFVRKRIRYPTANVQHFVTHWADAGRIFVHVTLRVINTGNVLIPIGECLTWIEQLTPLPELLQSRLAEGRDPDLVNGTELVWGFIQQRKLDVTKHFEVEPGEQDEFHFDFILEPTVSRVLIYSRVENPKKRGLFGSEKMGWNLSTVYEINASRKVKNA